MPAALRIVPESALPLWQSHPWHQEIAAFRLPEEEVLTLQSAHITASRYLGGQSRRKARFMMPTVAMCRLPGICEGPGI